MQELVGRLTALDPEASESLKVIAYFDALVDGHANAEVLLRGAAVLSGCAAAVASESIRCRVDRSGIRSTEAPTGDWPSRGVSGGGRVWIERSGEPHANDDMILERLAIAFGILFERSAPAAAVRRAVETLIDAGSSSDDRAAAAKRLRLDPAGLYRIVASATTASEPAVGSSAVIATPVGSVRATVRTPDDHRVDDPTVAAREGIGPTTDAAHLDASWDAALVALRLTSEHAPVVRADDLGPMLILAQAADAWPTEPADVTVLRHTADASPRNLALLDAIVGAESLRAAALDAGIHHSTMQAKAAELSDALGYDIRTPAGRTRLSLALALYRLATNRF